ncbi:MAG: class I SAM-dependent methyltransferase [Methanotrichaceae archaeon]|nr:class I SAM-dependent methyltransferase [Methanotrichaceae archaeon]
MPRQGPGDDGSTKRAFQKLTGLPEHPDILDIGCGSGKQTLVLAGLTAGTITAIDNHHPFIEILKKRYAESQYASDVTGICGDMASLDYKDESFDLIWSEGAAYIMGFVNALKSWRRLLRPNGHLVVSELVWFGKEAPREAMDYFAKEYPDMRYYEDICPLIESAGYEMIDYFPLPHESWWMDYYRPIEEKIRELKNKYRDDTDAQAIFDLFNLEIDMHRRYSDYYGYGFYVMKKKG